MSRCLYCKAPVIGNCSWPVSRFVVVPVKDLRPGEIVRRCADTGEPKTGRIARVASIFHLQNGWAQVKVHIFSAVDPKKIIRLGSACVVELRAERLAACQSPVCEAHARDVGDSTVYCQGHWNAWECAA